MRASKGAIRPASKVKVRLAVPDLHFPFVDKAAVARCLKHVAEVQPSGVDLIGDGIDAYPASRFDKNPARKHTLQDELDDYREFLEQLREAAPAADIKYSEGNHESRIKRMLWGNAKAFAGLRNLAIPELLKLSDLHISYHETGKPYRIGNMWYMHGEVIRKHGGSTARTTADRVNGSVIVGHSHRMGWVPTASWTGNRDAYEIGHLSDWRKLDYVSGPPQWQSGWAVAYISEKWHDVSFVKAVHHPGRHGTSYIFQGRSI